MKMRLKEISVDDIEDSPYYCANTNDTKRLINMGSGVEQRPWTPTVRRGKIAAETASPGPACVALAGLVGSKVPDSKKLGAPAFTIGRKYRKTDSTVGPGPAQYNVVGLGAKGRDSPPAHSLQSRHPELSKFQTPAPGEYDVSKSIKCVIDSTPMYTFGQKHKASKLIQVPGPNVYSIPSILGVSKEGPIRSAPAYSITGRHKSSLVRNTGIPGPGQYDAQMFSVVKRPPMFSMAGKHPLPADHCRKPGPGAHCPEKYVEQKSVPARTFAIRHSQYCGTRKAYLAPECRYQKIQANLD